VLAKEQFNIRGRELNPQTLSLSVHGAIEAERIDIIMPDGKTRMIRKGAMTP